MDGRIVIGVLLVLNFVFFMSRLGVAGSLRNEFFNKQRALENNDQNSQDDFNELLSERTVSVWLLSLLLFRPSFTNHTQEPILTRKTTRSCIQ